jgi:hypothetical protein
MLSRDICIAIAIVGNIVAFFLMLLPTQFSIGTLIFFSFVYYAVVTPATLMVAIYVIIIACLKVVAILSHFHTKFTERSKNSTAFKTKVVR